LLPVFNFPYFTEASFVQGKIKNPQIFAGFGWWVAEREGPQFAQFGHFLKPAKTL
jgi:hypothetical protein